MSTRQADEARTGDDDTPEARRIRELSRHDVVRREMGLNSPGAARSDLAIAEEEWARLAERSR